MAHVWQEQNNPNTDLKNAIAAVFRGDSSSSTGRSLMSLRGNHAVCYCDWRHRNWFGVTLFQIDLSKLKL